MDNFLKTNAGFETVCKLIETINRSTDDYLFIWDIKADTRWFFGNIDQYYDIRMNGAETNSTPDMLKIIHPADQAAVLESLQQIAAGKKDVHNMDYRWINRKGQKVWINSHGTVVRDADNKPHLMIGRVSEENLRHLFNPLTGLWNKVKLRKDLQEVLNAGKGYLMFLDIDNLAAINLSHGRQYGDMLLKEVAGLCENMEKISAAYHVDHNYFALILDGETEAQVGDIFACIQQKMQDKCTFTASAVPIDNTMFFAESQLLDAVNITLKKAKERSGNRIEFFSREELHKNMRSHALLEELKKSVENGFAGFELHYQPQVCSGDYALYGVEALLRYNSPSRGPVFPDEFIPMLEQSRLIKEVGLWVLREAATQCKKWQEFLPALRVSVNFSVLQFEDVYLAEKVIQTVRDVGLDGAALTVEITESVELHSSEQLINAIKQLRAYNIRIAIDDFGTGYANLGYLKQLNVDEIKIDRVFVSGIEQNTYNHKLVSNVIEFAKGNNIHTCCEGVENAQELVTLELLLPDVIQGYLFDKPNTPQVIENTYLNQQTLEYQNRCAFVQKIYAFKEKKGILRFDPKDILRENGVGLWVMRIKEDKRQFELHADETMEKIMGVDTKYTPKECYTYWMSNIHPDHLMYVKENVTKMVYGDKAVQIEFLWQHPKQGKIMVRMSGKRVKNADGMIVLEGYYRSITDVAGAQEGEEG